MERRLETIKSITRFIFVSDKPQKADIIIVPGSSHPQLPIKAVNLYKKGYAHKLIFTGGFNNQMGKNDCDFGKEIALKNGIPDKDIFIESVSTNTKENAIEALKVIKKYQLAYKTILLVSKLYHSRRLKMTFSKVFNDSNLLIIPVKDNRDITRFNWWKDREKTSKVMEEIAKISEYFQKGDLSLN